MDGLSEKKSKLLNDQDLKYQAFEYQALECTVSPTWVQYGSENFK